MIQTAILCGGQGIRLAADFPEIPKPLVEVGSRPILWHIMRHYSHFGFREFVLALGYKGELIKKSFTGPPLSKMTEVAHESDEFVSALFDDLPPVQILFRDSGLNAATGERIRLLRDDLKGTFFATYGDGLSNIDINELLAFHRAHGKIATVTVIQPHSNFGIIEIDNIEKGRVTGFVEKPKMTNWVNGGFFVFEEKVFDFILPGDILEREPMQRLVDEGQLMAWQHAGFWQCMDTYKDTLSLNELWSDGNPPWAPWKAAVGGAVR